MLDPFPVPRALYNLTKPYADQLKLHTLPFHVHEVFVAFVFYTAVERVISPYLSSKLIPKYYNNFPRRTKVNWDIHITAFVQSLVICAATLVVILKDTDLVSHTWQDALWGYSPAAGVVQAMASGYFFWDLSVCLVNYKILGPFDLAHSIAGLLSSLLGFRPFALYYGMRYLLFELSTPFVNIHWCLDKINMTGSSFQWYNGVILIVSFGTCRLIFGSWLAWAFFRDIWKGLSANEMMTTYISSPGLGKPVAVDHSLPPWLAYSFLAIQVTFMSLNVFWFSKMIDAVRKRFTPAQGGTATVKGAQAKKKKRN